MESGSESHSTLWSRISKLFSHRDDDEVLEKAISDARADGTVAADEESMLLSILRFNDLQVQDVMTPRTDIDCVAIEHSLADIAHLIAESGHSRIPVFKETRDNIVGIVHARDLLRHLLDDNAQAVTIAELMRQPFFVPETKSIRDMLQEFRSRKLHIAIVLDEYGGTAGLLTIEDVLEEIVGDIEDEHDAPKEQDIRPLADNKFELTGRAFLEDLEELGIVLESDEVDTIGGYLSMLAGHVPVTGERFRLDEWDFVIEEADAKTIRRISVSPARDEQQTA